MAKMKIGRSLFVDFLCIIFGLGSWITVNGVWVELPQLVLHLPEGWDLPSYLSVIVQLANIGPITYTLFHVMKPSPFKDIAAVTLTTVVGSNACLLLSFFWKETIYFLNQTRSISLFILIFFMALVDCTSSVLFLPFMSVFKEKYMISYMVGEGLSGFIPSVLALFQGVVGNPECRNSTVNSTSERNSTSILEPFYPDPTFSTSIFFIVLFLMDISSLVAFILLNFLPAAKKEKVYQTSNFIPRSNKPEILFQNNSYPESSNDRIVTYSYVSKDILEQDDNPFDLNDYAKTVSPPIQPTPGLAREVKVFLLLVQAWLCALSNGVFTSIQSYSGLPYGNRTFHLCVSLSTMANPLACCIAFKFPTRKTSSITILTIGGTVVSCYLMATAILSPNPPLLGMLVGEILVVGSWIMFVGLFSYAKTCVASILREEGRQALFWCGVSTQAGSALGALVMFVLVNIYRLFKGFNPCEH